MDDAVGAHAFSPASGAGGAAVRAGGRPTGGRRTDGSVRRLSERLDRRCARPACQAPAVATLSFSYTEREVDLAPLVEQRQPQTYDLCTAHAARTRPPHGWQLRDRRPEDTRQPDARPSVPADLGGDRTVAVLAAALRAVPGAVSEDAVPPPTAEIVPDPVRLAAAGQQPAPAVPRARPVPAAERRTAR